MALGDNKLSIWVGLRAEQFQKGINKVQSGFKTLNRTIGAFSTAFVGQQIFQLGKQFADAAGEMETVERSFVRSFAGIADSAEKDLNRLAETLDRNETQLKKGAVSFNAFFSGLGFVSKEAGKMSVKMQTLSLDLASFFGIADSNAQKRFLSALAGSPEVLDQFGINLKQSALQLELYRMGLKSTVQNTDEVIKTQARLNIIMRAMTDAGIVGDAERNLNTYQGTLKRFNSSWITFSENVGQLVLPAINFLMEGTNKLFKVIDKFSNMFSEKDIKDAEERLERLRKAYKKVGKELTEIELSDAMKISQSESPIKPKVELRAESDNEAEDQLRILGEVRFRRLIAINKLLKEQHQISKDNGILGNDNEKTEERIKNLQNDKREILVVVSDQLKEEKRLRDSTVKNYQAEIKAVTDRMEAEKTSNELQSLSRDALIEQSKILMQQIPYQEEIVALTGEGADELERQKKKYDEIYLLLQSKPLAPTITPKFDFSDLSGKELDLSSGHMITDAKSKDNIGVLLGLGTSAQQEKNFNELMAEKSKMIAKSLTTSKEELGKGTAKVKEDLLHWIDVLRPITDAVAQIWSQILTPPDNTISKEEQKEKTQAAFAGIMVGLGQAMVSLGTGALLLNKGIQSLGTGNIGPALLMIAGGSALIAIGKGQLQKVKNKAHAREQATGGGANRSGAKGGFSAMLEAIQGEQVFRLAGNDLVTAINRTNTFQRSIGSTRFG
jgi:hypothetical protein